jgi:predicted restriction endonuclease
MSNVYPYLYLLENSMREFINNIMVTQYGMDWWSSQVPEELQKKVTKRMRNDQKNEWHQRRGDRPIDYLDLKDLPLLMNIIESFVVPNIIPSLDWFRNLIGEVYESRCVVCHMNPLEDNNIKNIEVKFVQWEKQIDAKKDLIFKLNSK